MAGGAVGFKQGVPAGFGFGKCYGCVFLHNAVVPGRSRHEVDRKLGQSLKGVRFRHQTVAKSGKKLLFVDFGLVQFGHYRLEGVVHFRRVGDWIKGLIRQIAYAPIPHQLRAPRQIDKCQRIPRADAPINAVAQRVIHMGKGGKIQMAAGALRAYGYVLMKLARVPAGKSPLVATVAIGDRYAGERRIGNVVGDRPVRWRERSAVAGRALVGNGRLGVIPACGIHARHAVAACAVGRSWDVNSRFSRGPAAVMATCTIGGRRELAVVRLGCRPVGGRFMAGFAIAGHRGVDRRCGLAGEAKVRAQVAGRALV